MARQLFKSGQQVKVVKTGKLAEEWEDWAEIAYAEAGLEYPGAIATVESDDGGDHMAVRIVGSGCYIDHRHFEAV